MVDRDRLTQGFGGLGGGGDSGCTQRGVDCSVVDAPGDVVNDVPCSYGADVVVDGGTGEAARHG